MNYIDFTLSVKTYALFFSRKIIQYSTNEYIVNPIYFIRLTFKLNELPLCKRLFL